MAKIILRVDDCGWTPDKADDRGLAYFREWRDAFGIAGLPVYYGFIPATLGMRELEWLSANIDRPEEISVHGWDHAEGPVARKHMRFAVDLFSAGRLFSGDFPPYIPPFNRYDSDTINEWRWACNPIAGKSAFFGGFPDDGQSLNYGPRPVAIDGRVMHLPALRPLYDRAGLILERLPEYLHFDYPIVVTLHATWDAKNLAALRPLRDALAPHLVGVQAAFEWLNGGAK